MTVKWKQPAVPRSVAQMLVMDKYRRVLIMHRSNNVRSARNVWSIPTGTHEIGETIQQTIHRELKEEYDLTAIGTILLDQYENIAGDPELDAEQYHWLIGIYGVVVEDLNEAINKEPDKHDKMSLVPKDQLNYDFFNAHQFHESWHLRFKREAQTWCNRLSIIVQTYMPVWSSK